MGLRINSNVSSLRAQHSLQETTKRLNQSLTRLSTGLRINNGSDDVVGLVSSELLRARIRGIGVAQQNVSKATSFMGVAEGYLSQLTEIAQSMREMAVQASDSTVAPSSRRVLQDSFDVMMEEYNRLASGANFNGVNLLDGTFSNKQLQIGANEGETLGVSIGDARSSTIGEVAVFTSVTVTSTSTAAAATADFEDPQGNITFTVGTDNFAVNTGDYSSDGVSFLEGDESAIAYTNAINSIAGSSGVTATVLDNTFTVAYGLTAGEALEANQSLIINGVTVKSNTLEVSVGDDGDASSLVSLINDNSTRTGVEATLNTASQEILLTATDGRNITLQIDSTGASGSSFNAFNIMGAAGSAATTTQATYRGTFKMTSDEDFTVNDGTTSQLVAGAATQSVSIDATTALDQADISSDANASSTISVMDHVLTQLQGRRSTVGNTQHRLDLVLTELRSRQENLTSSESLIRDADIAVETARLTQDQILQQAGVTVLSQANASPQIALSLLQNL